MASCSQDQLVLQMIKLMDSLLKDDKLDLCLTPYSVLATSKDDGFVQVQKLHEKSQADKTLTTLNAQIVAAQFHFQFDPSSQRNLQLIY